MLSRTAKIVEGGKLIIPASFRRELQIAVGDTVVMELTDGEIRVRSRKTALRRVQERVRDLGKRTEAVTDSLVDDVHGTGFGHAVDG